MKKKIIKSISITILIIIAIILAIVAYFLLVDIETKTPQKDESKCDIETQEFMGRKIFIVTPKNREKTNTKILYFHGGSYVAEATNQHWDFIENIVNDTGATVILPDYPLTPKYTYKDVFKMVVPLYKEIIDRIDTEYFIIMGDSAGGGLGLALEERIGEEDLPMPRQTILISPWLDVRLTNPEIDKVQKNDKELNEESLKLAGIAYAGNNGINNYLVNPIDGDLSKLKNITIFTGTYDILNPDVHVFEEKAKNQGTDIKVKEYEKAGHIWIVNQKGDKKLIEKAYQDLLEVVNYIKS